VAVVLVLVVTMLLSALGLSLTLVATTEQRIATSYLFGSETFYAADAAFELAVQELARLPDWSGAIDGSVTSSFVDAQASLRPWPDGVALNSSEATALVTCGRTFCTDAHMDARTEDRPWGANNARWRLFAYGPLQAMSRSGAVNSAQYVAVWVGDDAMENDGNPFVDGDEPVGANPGRGVLNLLVHAYGSGSRRKVEATVLKTATGVRVLSWRENR
jgi:hypothetical protein